MTEPSSPAVERALDNLSHREHTLARMWAELGERSPRQRELEMDAVRLKDAARAAVVAAILASESAAVKAEKDAHEMTWGCLHMVREVLVAHLGAEAMKGTPPMMYPEAIQAAIAQAVRAEREHLTPWPTHHRYCALTFSSAAWNDPGCTCGLRDALRAGGPE